MRRRAEIAHAAAQNAQHAIDAALEAAIESVHVAESLHLSATDKARMVDTAKRHLELITQAKRTMALAVASAMSAKAMAAAVETGRLAVQALH